MTSFESDEITFDYDLVLRASQSHFSFLTSIDLDDDTSQLAIWNTIRREKVKSYQCNDVTKHGAPSNVDFGFIAAHGR